MSKPTEGDWLKLKRFGRYLKGHPRSVTRYDYQDWNGDVIVWTGSEWSFDPQAALIAKNDEHALQLEAVRDASQASGEVIEPYLVTVRRDEDGLFVPVHYRERLRTLGPSVRLDLGKQADLMGAR